MEVSYFLLRAIAAQTDPRFPACRHSSKKTQGTERRAVVVVCTILLRAITNSRKSSEPGYLFQVAALFIPERQNERLTVTEV